MTGTIDLNPGGVLAEAGRCRLVGDEDVPPGRAAMADGWEPVGLECSPSIMTCHHNWQGVFENLQWALVSVADKLQATANSVGHADSATVTAFDGVRPPNVADPTYDPSGYSAGSGG